MRALKFLLAIPWAFFGGAYDTLKMWVYTLCAVPGICWEDDVWPWEAYKIGFEVIDEDEPKK